MGLWNQGVGVQLDRRGMGVLLQPTAGALQ